MGDDETRVAIRRAARRMLLAGQAVDVGEVAAAVGVDRTTVFRRAGRRDLLVADALWSVGSQTWDRCLAEVPAGTPDRVAEVMTAFVRYLIEAPWFRTFLGRDPHRALRILTTAETPLQSEVVTRVRALLDAEPAPPAIELDPDSLAFLLVRVAESYSYADLIAGCQPDADAARTVFVALVGRRRG
jgi:AcrR family transcriptional regulator